MIPINAFSTLVASKALVSINAMPIGVILVLYVDNYHAFPRMMKLLA